MIKNQAITPYSSTFAEIAEVAENERKEVAHCSLMTSYRSTPEITALFAKLAAPDEQMHITSIQRDAPKPEIIACPSPEIYNETLLNTARLLQAESTDSLSAIITNTQAQAHELATLFEKASSNSPSFQDNELRTIEVVDESRALPANGVIVLPLDLAKGLEFDHVLIADASETNFDSTDLARRRLYTALSVQHAILLSCREDL